jgi:hypothetical protein
MLEMGSVKMVVICFVEGFMCLFVVSVCGWREM